MSPQEHEKNEIWKIEDDDGSIRGSFSQRQRSRDNDVQDNPAAPHIHLRNGQVLNGI